MIGGVTLNGQQIYTEALQDIEKLETEIRTSFELNSNDDRIKKQWPLIITFKAAMA